MAGQPTDEVPRLERFAPSTVNALMACPYRVALMRSGRAPRLPGTFTALGQVAHSIHEEAWSGKFTGQRGDALWTALADAWDRLVAREDEALRTAYALAQPPLPADWPGYAITRSRTLLRLSRLIEAPRGNGDRRAVRPELEISDPHSGLFGRVDRLETTAEGVRIIDLKSGAWQEEVTEEQRRQLMLYAAIVHASSGTWPSEVAIEDAGGREWALPVAPEEVRLLVALANDVVSTYNAAASRGWSAIEGLARPSDETCGNCVARIACEPYWRELKSDWQYHGAARGRMVKRLESVGAGAIVIETESPHDRAGAPTVIYRIDVEVAVEDIVAVVGAEQRDDPGTLRCRWNSQLEIQRIEKLPAAS